MSLPLKPIFYVAFADPDDKAVAQLAEVKISTTRLPELEIEETRIREALKDAVAEDSSWEYQQALTATRAGLVDGFYSNRVAIFHFGGHADPEHLLLPGEAAGRQVSSAVLLEDFLARQKALKFVFLNACSTREWAHNLVRLGVPCVIATLRDVNSEKALEFASAFYKLLAEDDTLADAFEKAKSSIHFTNDASANGAPAATRDIDEAEDCNPDVTSFPWEIYGDPEAQRWRLSIGADDPLIGLPHLDIDPEKLPDSPYVSIKGHTPDDAPIFFGRNAEIRTLYDWVLHPQADPPILLFYGQSGVGKSSLLNAGLFPRLEGVANVVYTRRNLNLIDDLHNATGGSSDQDARAWLNGEEPSLIILDQVEEAITHKVKKGTNGEETNDELHEFIKRVIEIFSLREAGSKARLILSFRKEYLAEIRNAFVAGTPPDTAPLVKDFWLERFDKKGIKQVVIGPTRVRALRDKYKITLADEDLPTDIAHDIEDRDSPIATVLQIILNQLWKAAQAAAAEAKTESLVYSRALYKSLSNTDNPLNGFFSEQLAKLDPDAGGVSNSDGLELDLLYEHTTALVTSTRRSLTDLKREYPQVPDLEQLLLRNKELYLLTDAGDGGFTTSLAHDTLAAVIRREFELSVKPGTRARRLLENRARGWTPDRTGDALDAADLGVVERGLAHMRAATADEKRLVSASRKQRLLNGTVKIVVLMLLPLLLGGLLISQVLDKWNDLQEANSNAAQDLSANDGVMALAEALQAERFRTSWQLRFLRSKDLDQKIGENLFNALQTREVYKEKVSDASLYLGDCAVALDEHDHPLFTMQNGKPYFGGFALPDGFSSHSVSMPTTACDPVSRTIAYLQNSPNTPKYDYRPEPFVFLWQKGKVSSIPLPTVRQKPSIPLGITMAPGGKELAFKLDLDPLTSGIGLLDLATGKQTVLPGLDGVNILGFSQDGRFLLLNQYPDVDVVDISLPRPHPLRIASLHFNDVAPGKVGALQVAAISGDNDLLVQSLSGKQNLVYLPDRAPDSLVSELKPTGVAISPDGKTVASAEGGRIDLWGIGADESLPASKWIGMPSYINHFSLGSNPSEKQAFSPDSQLLATLEAERNHDGPYEIYKYGSAQPTSAGAINSLHVRVWKVQPYFSQDLKDKNSPELFSMGCALIANYIADMAANPDIREDNQHFDFAGLQKACNSAQAGK